MINNNSIDTETHDGKYKEVCEAKERLLNVLELSELIRLTPGTIRVWVCQKKIPHIKMGRKVLFDEKDIRDWTETKKIQAQVF